MLCRQLELWITYTTQQCKSNYPAYKESKVDSEAIEGVLKWREKNNGEEEADSSDNLAVDDAGACIGIGIR